MNGFGNGKTVGVLDTVLGGDPDPEYQAYLEGQEAQRLGVPVGGCPYNMGKVRDEWIRGHGVATWKAKNMGGYQ